MKKTDSGVWAPLALLVGCIGTLVSFGATTQLIARAFGYTPILGRPLFGHFYQPLAAAMWLMNLDMRCYIVARMQRNACAPGTLALISRAQVYLGISLGITALVVAIFSVLAFSMRSRKQLSLGKR